jgi:hypothetical protein
VRFGQVSTYSQDLGPVRVKVLSGSRVVQWSLSAKGVTTDSGSIPGITSASDWESNTSAQLAQCC